jgi:[glutamine synthetase] adenylyltransferase / [glutamine synthetase]-adenylyl-L-tyrosine phosphorylase
LSHNQPGKERERSRGLAEPKANPGTAFERKASSGPHEVSLSHIPFHDPENARLIFARAAERLSADLIRTVAALLGESPDPDSALLLFERLVAASAETARLLEHHQFLAHYAILVFSHSRYLGETLLQNTDLFQSFLRERNLDRSFSREEFQESLARFRSRSFETDVSLLLARFKRREYVRIMLRDVLRIAPLAETTAEIAALSDVLIEDALREAESRSQRRHDPPQHLDADGRLVDTPFSVLAMGKLGGNELNYSSDVDLMFIFGDGEEPATARISNREYFIRLAQQVTEILSRVTMEGPVFRIDLRLRPQGGEGELAINLSHALHYYSATARDWEQQALIKVRHSAGDPGLAREFIRAVQAHVYAEEVNFAAIKTALVAREKMQKRRRSVAADESSLSIDVKLDPGGIRDIEFLVQCLQRVYGGAEPWLRSGGTLFSLQKLHDKRHISGKEFHDLTSAYEFLRHLEHRLQLRHGQQTHRLPATEPELSILQRSMEGYIAGEYRLANLVEVVKQRMTAVAEIYQRIIYQQQSRTLNDAPGKFELGGTAEFFTGEALNQQLLERVASDAPYIYQIATQTNLSPPARKNLSRFLGSALTGSERYAAVLRYQGAIREALVLFECSEFLADILVRNPEELGTLADLGRTAPGADCGDLFESSVESGGASADPVFVYLAGYSARYGDKLALLRQHYRHCVFAAGARDVTKFGGVYHSFAAGTATADHAITAAFEIAGAPEGLAILALGRLGSGEFDVLSDADLLFVCAENEDRQHLTKAAEQMVQALSAYTRDGMVFPVDARLRPRGGEGELLVSSGQLESYFAHEAQAWEALMYTKLRFVAGSQRLGHSAITARKVLFERFAADSSFLDAVRDMRSKLDVTEKPEKSFKTSPGTVYDLDFMTGFLLVKQAVANKQGTLRDRLWRCAEQGLLDKSEAAFLDHAAELLRTVEHIVRLVTGRARKWLPATEHARSVTEHLTAQILQRQFPRGLEYELDETCRRVREIYNRLR